MPRLLLQVVLALWAALSICVLAQDSAPVDPLAAYPSCASPCIRSAFSGGLCAPTDKKCICTDAQFQHNVTICVTESCSVPDVLAAYNTSMTSCGAPIRDRSGEYIVISNIMAASAGGIVFIRLAYKVFFSILDFGLDDWLVLATQAAVIPSAVMTVYATTANGLGKDIWTLSPETITNFVFYFYWMTWLYFLQVALVKLTMIAFYLRIFPAKEVQRLLWGTFIFTILWGVAFILTSVFQCWPISYFWTGWDGLHEGHCVSAKGIGWSNASLNILLDLWILAIPLWQIKKLHLHWKKKIGVVIMFCIGTFVTIMSIVRLQSLVHFASTNNATWESFDVSVWSTIEIAVGIICTCLPALRLILVRAFPILASSTLRSHGNKYYNYGSGRSRAMGATRGDAAGEGIAVKDTAQRPGSDPEADPKVAHFQKAYEVHSTSDDEIGLVQMNDLDARGKAARG